MALDVAGSATSDEVKKPAKPNSRELNKADRITLRDERKREQDALRREEATAIAADMEMGYYTPTKGTQWDAKPFVVAEVLRRMGYGEWSIRDGRRPRWWPGLDVFRRVVAWKVATRKLQSHFDFANRNPWSGPLVGLAVEEMGRRLAERPESVSDRDITDMITKLTRLFVEGRPGTAPAAGSELGGSGNPVARFTRTTEIFERIDDPRVRERMEKDYRDALAEAAAAIPAHVAPAPPAAPDA